MKQKTKIINDFFVFDTETGIRKKGGTIKFDLNARPDRFIFGVIYGYNFTKVIYSREEFISEFKHPRYKGKTVFAHNAEYDLTVLFGSPYTFDPEVVFNGKFISATNGNCRFADSLNIYRTKASVIGEMLGMPKTMTYDEINWNNKKQRADAINGCIRDCEIIWEALFRIFEKAGNLKITQASLSLEYFRRFHLAHDILHNDNTIYFFDSYFGGRCEAFRLGKVKGRVRDVNSMYPYIMDKEKFPDPARLKVKNNLEVKQLPLYMKKFEGMVYCTVKHKHTWIGYLPVKQNNKLIFPVGTFKGCWNFNELRFAIEEKVVEVISIDKIVYAPPIESPFKKYVRHLYAERFSTDNEFSIYVIKIFMNSLYGKMAQQIKANFVYIKDIDKSIREIREYQKQGRFVKLMMFSEERKDAFIVLDSEFDYAKDYSICSFASYITSGARIHLLKECLKEGKNNLLYCDTDSTFSSSTKKYKDDKELGGWKLENKVITYIGGLKNYKYKVKKEGKWLTKRRLKGVPESAKQIGKHKYTYTNLLKTKEALRRNMEPGVPIERTKVIKGIYTKRIVNKDGTTKPIIWNSLTK